MSHLEKYEFSEDDWADVQHFDCGDSEDALEVSDWLKAPEGKDGALNTIKTDASAKVWLYRNTEGSLVGFGAMAKARDGWRWTRGKDPKIPVNLILWFAVQRDFQKQPPGPRSHHYSGQILRDLMAEANKEQEDYPVLGLCVRTGNQRAIDLYADAGFTERLSCWVDKTTGIEYQKMAKILNPTRLLECLEAAREKRKK